SKKKKRVLYQHAVNPAFQKSTKDPSGLRTHVNEKTRSADPMTGTCPVSRFIEPERVSWLFGVSYRITDPSGFAKKAWELPVAAEEIVPAIKPEFATSFALKRSSPCEGFDKPSSNDHLNAATANWASVLPTTTPLSLIPFTNWPTQPAHGGGNWSGILCVIAPS